MTQLFREFVTKLNVVKSLYNTMFWVDRSWPFYIVNHDIKGQIYEGIIGKFSCYCFVKSCYCFEKFHGKKFGATA